ncbi:MAG: 3-methyl-2-oxobutanoate hydroxymethyltransferase [Chthonomonadales bacterium]
MNGAGGEHQETADAQRGQARASRITLHTLKEKKARGEKIVMLTCYDYPSARLLDEAGIDILLVGDSVGDNVLGYENTLPVTMDEMIHHSAAVTRGSRRAMVVADMPFLSYQASVEDALRNAGRLMKEAGVHAVKLEGGAFIAPTVRALVSSGIPVMAHVGFTPQSVYQLGGYRIQGRGDEGAQNLLADAAALEEAGAFAIVLELIPPDVAGRITQAVAIPTIGIGAGPHCDGQVLVFHDVFGYSTRRPLRHVRRYAELADTIRDAATRFAADVRNGEFPAAEQTPG